MSTKQAIELMAEIVNDEDLMAVHPFIFLLNMDRENLDELERDLNIMLNAVRDTINYHRDMEEYNDVAAQ